MAGWKRGVCVVAAAVLTAAGSVWAEPPGGERGRDKDWAERQESRMDKTSEKLGLKDEQKARLKEHREKHRGEMRALHEQMKSKKDAMKTELGKTDFDESRVRGLNDEIKSLQDRMADLRLQGILDVREILGPEKFKQFHAMMGEMKERKAGMKKRGDGPLPPPGE